MIPVSSIKYQSKKRLDTDEGAVANGVIANGMYNKVGRFGKDDNIRIPLSSDKRSNDDMNG